MEPLKIPEGHEESVFVVSVSGGKDSTATWLRLRESGIECRAVFADTGWEAPETYVRMSPFTYAHRIDEPLLMIHGRLDQNTGTFPIQSERLFHAIQGNGGTARLVLLPFENHGYAARESILETQAETIEWLDRHVKSAGPRKGVER